MHATVRLRLTWIEGIAKGAPLHHFGGCRTKRALDHGGDLIIVDRSRSAGARFVQQAFDAVLQKAPPPLADSMLVNAKVGGDGFAWSALCAPKNDPAAFR
jgi:hypothetical protein